MYHIRSGIFLSARKRENSPAKHGRYFSGFGVCAATTFIGTAGIRAVTVSLPASFTSEDRQSGGPEKKIQAGADFFEFLLAVKYCPRSGQGLSGFPANMIKKAPLGCGGRGKSEI